MKKKKIRKGDETHQREVRWLYRTTTVGGGGAQTDSQEMRRKKEEANTYMGKKLVQRTTAATQQISRSRDTENQTKRKFPQTLLLLLPWMVGGPFSSTTTNSFLLLPARSCQRSLQSLKRWELSRYSLIKNLTHRKGILSTKRRELLSRPIIKNKCFVPKLRALKLNSLPL